MRTTLTIDEDAYETVMHISTISGERPGKVVSHLIRKALHVEATQSRKTRFPVFEVEPAAAPIEASRIQRVIDEEGLI